MKFKATATFDDAHAQATKQRVKKVSRAHRVISVGRVG